MKPVADFCATCGAPGLKHWGLGTERVESEIRKAFPSARVARMDSDTMSKRTAYASALGDFRSGKTDILVGTQMIAKGLDFPNVTLVGVVLADTALHMPDFRSRERTFQLLAQVAGRAGRSEKGGRVIVQTHLPKDPAVRAASLHDFEAFSLAELQERRAYSYPPFTRLARILIRGKDAKATAAAADSAAQALRAELKQLPVVILGPAEAPISKIEGFHRHHILLKAGTSKALEDLLASPAGDALAKLKGADATIDVDPLSML
jgi:primosomal protein N' (replication factor Y)